MQQPMDIAQTFATGMQVACSQCTNCIGANYGFSPKFGTGNIGGGVLFYDDFNEIDPTNFFLQFMKRQMDLVSPTDIHVYGNLQDMFLRFVLEDNGKMQVLNNFQNNWYYTTQVRCFVPIGQHPNTDMLKFCKVWSSQLYFENRLIIATGKAAYDFANDTDVLDLFVPIEKERAGMKYRIVRSKPIHELSSQDIDTLVSLV